MALAFPFFSSKKDEPSRSLTLRNGSNNPHTITMQTASTEIPELSEKDKERFWSRVDKSGGPDACWPWIAINGKKNYGVFYAKKRTVKSHRVAFFLAFGQIPKGEGPHGTCICHHCDNPPCVNPAHLFSGTNKENVEDRVKKGRTAKSFGDNNSARRHPDRLARGDRNGARLHPERLPRGDAHPARLHPERLARGERNGSCRISDIQCQIIMKSSKPSRAMAAEIGCSKSQVLNIRAGRHRNAVASALSEAAFAGGK